MTEPNSPRLRAMLDVLQGIYKNEDRTTDERLEAIDFSLQIMSRRVRRRNRSKKDRSLENQLAAIRKLQGDEKQ